MFEAEQIETIARVCHEANRGYCDGLGDHSQEIWDLAPDWQKESAINGVKFCLLQLSAVGKVEASDTHHNWLVLKQLDGWTYAPVKNVNLKQHPCLVPFDQLPSVWQMKDALFCAIVTTFYQHATALDSFQGVPEDVLDRMTSTENSHWWVSETINGEKYIGRPATAQEIDAYRAREKKRQEAAEQANAAHHEEQAQLEAEQVEAELSSPAE